MANDLSGAIFMRNQSRLMQTVVLGNSPLRVSRLAYGCWRLTAADKTAVVAAFESGYTLFDHADIYGRGEGEKLFGEVLREVPGMRDRVYIITKAGVRRADDPSGSPYHYNLSGEHLIRSCEGSLRRLGVETIDVFLLHRADWLVDPAEVAQAFAALKASGKVRYFGLSNFRPSLVMALQAACPMPLVAHQVEISLGRLGAFEDGTLDQCLAAKMTPMAWSPLGGGQFADGARRLLKSQEGYRTDGVLPLLDDFAKPREATRATIALAWLLKHPSGILPVVGSTRPERIREAARATEMDLSREEWYRLLMAARGEPLP